MRSFILCSAFIACTGAIADPMTVDLDKPGALDELKIAHPQRYQAVAAVLQASERLPCQSGEMETLKARFNLKDLECGVALLTSYPPQRHVHFALEGTSYTATVMVTDVAAVAQPATRAVH
jgi:hypothetical protein